ncbi:hypothetical protein TetV_443 [Tetraselmis virus 1]|uniref:Transposase n=1 Tax=Tetraselmis virus 1 TaxID=2060617 RepID=A0A2P0VNN9_9VIRU|nr:hypothetical protein QJ968_gp611 [Tetraselmis virus 1]AUF82525.1 hypothetical protein TetV_443 [Tetraselmis virus 1]
MSDSKANEPKKRQRGNVSRLQLDALLKDVEGEDTVPWWNHRLNFAASNGLISDLQLRRSLSYRNSCVKTSLRSIGVAKPLQDRFRLYSIACSKIQHRLGAVLNMAVVIHKDNEASLCRLASVCQDVQSLRDIMLDGPNPKPLEVVLAETRYPSLLRLGPSDEEISLMSSWDQAKTYIANRFVANVQVHVRSHLQRRIKKSLRSRINNTENDVAMKYVFSDGTAPEDSEDREHCERMKTRLYALKLLSRDGFTLPKREKVSPDMMLLHFDLCKEEIASFQPLPMATTLSRCHARICERVYGTLTKGMPNVPEFSSLVRERRKRVVPRRKWTKKAFRQVRRSQKAKKSGKRKQQIKKRRKQQKLKPDQQIDSLETDGYSVSLALKTPHKNPADNLSPEEKFEKHIARLKKVMTKPDAFVAGNDPGRKNLATQALLSVGSEVSSTQASRVQFTRSQWNSVIRSKQQRAWEEKRRNGPVKTALDALSSSGGKKSCNEDKWAAYLTASVENQRVLHQEFLENDERQRRRFLAYGRRQRAIDRVASRMVNTPDRKPLVIGYGNGSFPCHGRGGSDTSVPVKSLYRAVIAAFKKKRICGGVIKVWEYFTTAKCYRCHNRMEKMFKTVDGKKVEDRDFRCCATCTHEEHPKLRNRDWNAALNILVLTIAILKGEDRPEYLKPEKKKRRSAKRKADGSSIAH